MSIRSSASSKQPSVNNSHSCPLSASQPTVVSRSSLVSCYATAHAISSHADRRERHTLQPNFANEEPASTLVVPGPDLNLAAGLVVTEYRGLAFQCRTLHHHSAGCWLPLNGSLAQKARGLDPIPIHARRLNRPPANLLI